MHWVIIDLTITGVMDETSEASNATMIDEVESYIQDPTSKQSTTSN